MCLHCIDCRRPLLLLLADVKPRLSSTTTLSECQPQENPILPVEVVKEEEEEEVVSGVASEENEQEVQVQKFGGPVHPAEHFFALQEEEVVA